MTTHRVYRRMRPLWVARLALFVCIAAGRAQDDDTALPWLVEDAPIRFEVGMTNSPTHGAAGCFIALPDGGILPKPFPQPTVYLLPAPGMEQPRELKSYVMWQNVANGISIITEKPPFPGRAHVYLSPTDKMRTWKPETGLKPSPFLAVSQQQKSWPLAERMANMGNMPERTHWRYWPGKWRTPTVVPGDLTGYQGNVTCYYLLHYNARDPGRTLFGLMPKIGKNRVRFNGQYLDMKVFSGKRGGIGAWVENVTGGLHRLDLMTVAFTGHAYFRGLVNLTLITPNTNPKLMGGINHTGDGKPFWASRLFHWDEFAYSAGTPALKAQSKEGAPPAWIHAWGTDVFWFDPDIPIIVYKFSAHGAGHPEGTRYIWTFEDGARVEGKDFHWLLWGDPNATSGDNLIPPGDEKLQKVTLTTEYDGKRSTASTWIYPYSKAKTSLEDAKTRDRYRQGMLQMFRAYPSDKDPSDRWPKAVWNNFFRVLEMNNGEELLMHIMSVVNWDELREKIEPEQEEQLRDILLDYAPRISPQLGLKWTAKVERETRDPALKNMMRVAHADVLLYYMDQMDEAQAALQGVARRGGLDAGSELARIRLGDIAFMSGKQDVATKLYGSVQGRAKRKNPELHRAAARKAAPRLSTSGLARTRKELDERRNKAEAEAEPEPEPKDRTFTPTGIGDAEKWKVDALLDVAAAETVARLIHDGFYLEAKKALREWELNFPLSKLTGDFIVHEARLYMALGDYKRARAMLEPYVEYVDASSFLPDAISLLLTCKNEMGASQEEIIAYCEQVKDKVKFHPLGGEIRRTLAVYKMEKANEQQPPTRP